MFNEISKWLDSILIQEVPDDVVAFCFNLYENGNNSWSMEIVGTDRFDLNDEDWCCEEVTDFGSRDNCYTWEEPKKWNEILSEVVSILKKYLECSTYAYLLKEKSGIGVGFVDGNIEIIYYKQV